MLQFPPCCEDQILVASAGVRDLGLTHRHLSPAPPPPIEVMRNRPTARVRHGGFESNDFVLDPSGLEWDEDVAGRNRPLTAPSAWRICVAFAIDTRSAIPMTRKRQVIGREVCHRIPL